MSVDAETYIVISLMFAVFAAVAAVGSSMVLGAGFERLRAGFDVVRRQSGFFADAIHKLDQRTLKLDEETAKLKSGFVDMGDRVSRVEKQTVFLGDAINSIEQRILQGTPAQTPPKNAIRMHPVHTVSHAKKEEPLLPKEWMVAPVREQMNDMPSIHAESTTQNMLRDFADNMIELSGAPSKDYEGGRESIEPSKDDAAMGITTLISRYWSGEQSGSGKQVVYH